MLTDDQRKQEEEAVALAYRLQEAVEAGEPWPAETDRTVRRLAPAKLMNIVKSLGVRIHSRDRHYHPSSGKEVDLRSAMRNFLSERPDLRLVRPTTILADVRSELAHYLSKYSPDVARRVWHVFQVQLQPTVIRNRLQGMIGLTFVPGQRRSEFPGEGEFTDLTQTRAMTLSLRRHRLPNDDRVIDMFDVKTFSFEVDPDSGVVYVGGDGVRNGVRYSRCTMARHYNLLPFPGASGRVMPSDHVALVESSLALHRQMEWVGVGGGSKGLEPEFPEIWLGFAQNDVEMEITAELENRAYRMVDAYVRNGRPSVWPRRPELVQLRSALTRPETCWRDYAEHLSSEGGEDSDSRLPLLLAWTESQTEWDGLYLTPLELFQPYSPQAPVRKAVRILARWPRHLLGRREPAPDGWAFHPLQARCQVIHLDRDDEALQGSTGRIEYDFGVIPLGTERYFQRADEVG